MSGFSAATDGAGPGQVSYEWESMPPATAVVEAVADATGRGQTELEPLARAVDPDALNALFDRGARDRDDTAVSFVYAGCGVTVQGTGTIAVRLDTASP